MATSTYRFVAACALWGVLGLCLGGVGGVYAEQAVSPKASAPKKEPQDLRDPGALAELKRATDFLMKQPRFHYKATIASDVIQEDGRRLQFEKFGDVFLQRPDRMYVEMHLDDGRHRQIWYDGKTLSVAERSKNLHTQVKAPPTIDAMLDMLEGLLGDPMPLSDLLYNDLSPLGTRASEADVVGDSKIHGRPCRQLAFRGEIVDWQVWIEKGQRPLIRKMAISYRQEPGVPQYVAWLDHWDFPKSFKKGIFTFTAPEGSKWINVMVPRPRKVEKGGRS